MPVFARKINEEELDARSDEAQARVFLGGNETKERVGRSGPGECQSCGARSGQLHGEGCPNEVCPNCGGSLSGCGCSARFERTRPRVGG